MNKFKLKLISTSLALLIALANPLAAFAFDMPVAPTPPPAPTAPAAPTMPVITVTPPPAPTMPPAFVTPTPKPTPSPTPTPTPTPVVTTPVVVGPAVTTDNTPTTNNPVNNDTSTNTTTSDPKDQGGNVGDTTINTGNGVVGVLSTTDANNNAVATDFPSCSTTCGTGTGDVSNTGNGTDSTNNATGTTTNSTGVGQNNNLNLNNNLGANSTTGSNLSNRNVGSTTINTGDADVVLTSVNLGNNNGINPQYQEFNVLDNQTGDLTFNFADPSTSGNMQLTGNQNVGNIGNGANSTNTATGTTTNTSGVDQNNTVDANNDIQIVADSGDNSASRNTGGDNSISTGNANVTANLINFLNNNIVAGANFLIGVANIYGTLNGNIILPHDIADAACVNCASTLTTTNTGNGDSSTNTTTGTLTNTNDINQTNDGTIANNLTIGATTGGNSTDRNTGGNNSITTGNVDVNSKTINVMNNNIDSQNGGDVWWLVLVNNMGTWVGHILGAPNGATTAGSGMEFTVAPDGSIVAMNDSNGAGSTNNASSSTTNTNSVNQTNTAALTNNVNIDANTGGNHADRNTGGNSSITTGNVNVAANIVNFINNNFIGHKFVISIVNIFGTLIGDIVPPDQPIPTHPQELSNALQNGGGIGGDNTTTTNNASTTTNNSGVSTTSNSNHNSLNINLGGTNISTNNAGAQVLGISAEKLSSVKDTVDQIPLDQAIKHGFSVNYFLITLALLIVVGATTIRHLVVRRRNN